MTKVLAWFAVLMLASSAASADNIACLTSRTGSYAVNWAQLGPAIVPYAFNVTSSPGDIKINGSYGPVGNATAFFTREGNSFLGDFAKSDGLLLVQGNDLRLEFFDKDGYALGVSQFGAQIEPQVIQALGSLNISAYDQKGSLLGSCSSLVTNQGKENNSVAYVGIQDLSSDNIHKVGISVVGNRGAFRGIAINKPSITKTCVEPPNTTMVAWYAFDESSSFGNPNGSSVDRAMGNSGVWKWGILGPPVPVPGRVGNALRFNGINQYVEAPSNLVTNFGHGSSNCSVGGNEIIGTYSACSGDFSIDTWIRAPGPTSSDLVILDKRNGAYGYSLALKANQLLLQLADGSSATNYASANLVPFLQGTDWHHIAVTVSRLSTTGIKWYYDGALLSTNNPTGRSGYLVGPNGNNPLRIGANHDSPPTGWLLGDLDELEIYNRALTTAEVRSIYNAGRWGKCKPQPACTGDTC